MAQIVVNSTIRNELRNLSEALEFRDENGKIVGYFIPASCHSPTPEEELVIPFSAEELAEIINQPDGGRPLVDILADLEKLP